MNVYGSGGGTAAGGGLMLLPATGMATNLMLLFLLGVTLVFAGVVLVRMVRRANKRS